MIPREIYGIKASSDLISAVTDTVLEEIATWRARSLEPAYPLVFNLLHHSLDFVAYKDRKLAAAALKGIYRAVDAADAADKVALGAFDEDL